MASNLETYLSRDIILINLQTGYRLCDIRFTGLSKPFTTTLNFECAGSIKSLKVYEQSLYLQA